MEQKEIDKLVNELVTKENNLRVLSKMVNLTPGSLGNPYIRVGTLPFYDWHKKKQITYVITGGRFLNCDMLVYDAYKKDKDYFVTKSIKKAKEKVEGLIKHYIAHSEKLKKEVQVDI